MSDRILIVEDDQDVARLMAARLASVGYEVRAVVDGALAIKEAQGFRPNLVVLDLMLPAGGGQSVLQRLKLSSHTNTIPVIVVTGVESEESKRQLMKQGVAAYLRKPYEPQALIAKVKELVRPQTLD
ncbi:MAG: response regulator transcription factor [Nitrospiraceae bacterium]|nr:response regulator transcription factor [Nitrospiraceae bacterium]